MLQLDRVALRYLANGAVATGVHFAVLWTCMRVLEFGSAGMANFSAALVASTVAFIGNRYVVFPGSTRKAGDQVRGFVALYLAAAVFHGMFLYTWSDLCGLHYGIGFVLATALQVLGVYFFNRKVVFA